jgi:hypothetical protein
VEKFTIANQSARLEEKEKKEKVHLASSLFKSNRGEMGTDA